MGEESNDFNPQLRPGKSDDKTENRDKYKRVRWGDKNFFPAFVCWHILKSSFPKCTHPLRHKHGVQSSTHDCENGKMELPKLVRDFQGRKKVATIPQKGKKELKLNIYF